MRDGPERQSISCVAIQFCIAADPIDSDRVRPSQNVLFG